MFTYLLSPLPFLGTDRCGEEGGRPEDRPASDHHAQRALTSSSTVWLQRALFSDIFSGDLKC